MAPAQFIKDRYKIVTTINHGSFGVVSLAKDTWKKNALVALKCIHKQADSFAIDEAKEEIAIHERLGAHKNIAALIDHFETDDDTYLIMEYYPEGDLYEAIRAEKGPRDTGYVLEFMLQLIEAVEYAHSKGVYHRDIKPENILIASDGSVRLADWGLASTIRENSEFGVGSERYMAPELFDKNIDYYDAEKADIWSIGICLLNILFSRNPFTIATQKDKLFMDYASNREAIFDIFPTLTSDVFAVLRHSLTIDPDNRSLALMREELLKVNIWTTDDEYFCDDDLEQLERAVSLESMVEEVAVNVEIPSVNVSAAPSTTSTAAAEPTAGLQPGRTPASLNFGTPMLMQSIVPTTVDREPLRTPTLLNSPESFSSSFSWNRTMQFTPPTLTYLPRAADRKKLAASGLSHVISQEESEPPMAAVSEEDEVFSMDSIGHALSQIEPSPSGTSETSSISSVPSLVQSQKDFVVGSTISKNRAFGESAPMPSVAIPKTTTLNMWNDPSFAAYDDEDEDELFKAIESSLPKMNKLHHFTSSFNKPKLVSAAQSRVAVAAGGAPAATGWKRSSWQD
jgi:serine/threonine protein kinase